MNAKLLPVPFPCVRFFAGRSESFIQCGEQWRRMTPEDEARSRTGYDRETHEPNLGVFIIKRPNGLLRFGFDLGKLDANLSPAAVAHIECRWRAEASNFSKPLLRSSLRRAHFAKSFAEFEVAPERVEEWKRVLETVLSDPNSYEPIERRMETTS